MEKEDLLKWFLTEVLPSMVSAGRLSEKNEIQSVENCEFENFSKGVENFASVPYFAKLALKTAQGTICRNIIVKFQIQDPIVRETMKMVSQFQNEITFYNEVLPEFDRFLTNCNKTGEIIRDIFPKCYYAFQQNENFEKAIVILEDLRQFGYKMAESKVEMDLDHCLVALGQLARFHAISFAMKFLDWKNFEKLKTSFKNIWYEDDPQNRQLCQEFKGRCCLRGINYLLFQTNSSVPKEYLEALRKKLEPIFNLLKDINSPKEPMSVICHGDFNRNNILFKYEGGKPVVAKIIDFQIFLYGSPCLDLSFFIYMNTTQEFRNRHFDQIFQHYYSTLTSTIACITNTDEKTIINWIPLNLFKNDFERVCIGAYVTASFFLPVMMAPSGEDLDETLKAKTFKEMAEENCNQGGEIVSRRISDIIVDFYKRNFFLKGS